MIWNLAMGEESKMWNRLHLKDLVFGAPDIDDDLMIKKWQSVLRHKTLLMKKENNYITEMWGLSPKRLPHMENSMDLNIQRVTTNLPLLKLT